MINISVIVSKVLSESLLSLYPVFVKNIGLSINIQLWSRLIIYFIISLFLCNLTFVKDHIFSFIGLLLGFTNLIHIYSSYKGFQLLESGIAYTLFYIYPIIILLLAGKSFHWSIILAFIGTIMLLYEQIKSGENEKTEEIEKTEDNKKTEENEKTENTTITENYKYEGFTMIFLAALTEALIYFQVRSIKTKNNWDHLLIAYFLGAIIMSIYMFFYGLESEKERYKNKNDDDDKKEETTIYDLFSNNNKLKRIGIALLINGFIGSIGYFLRFYAATRLEPLLYASLSYIGIFMSFVYGIIFNKESFTLTKLIGSIFIFISYYLIAKKKLVL